MRKLASRARVPSTVWIGIVLLIALALRLWGSGYGLPAYTHYHPDEHALVERAAAILWTGDWNLGHFNYPAFYAYIQTLAHAGYFLYGAAQGLWSQVFPFTIPEYYHVSRVVTALFGTLSVLVVYLVGREMFRRRAALLASVLLATSYLHIVHSHYATFDVMVAFLAALTLLFSELLRTRGEPKWYLLAGLCAGLAGATKYNGAVVMLVPLAAHILATPWGEWGWLNSRLFLALAGFTAGFFGGNPYALGNMDEFLNGLALVLHHYGTNQPGFEGTGNWRWYLRATLTSADALWVFTAIAGLAGMFWREWRKGLLVVLFPVVYYLMISSFVVRFERNLVPLLPFMALGGGWLVDMLADRAALWLGRSVHWSQPVALVSVVIIAAAPVVAAISFDAALADIDHREIAGEWVEENIEWGSKIAIEHYSIPFDHTEYWVKDVIRITDHELDWYVREGYDFLIISDGVWELLLQHPDIYRQRTEAYRGLVEQSTLVAEFVPDPPKIVVAGYPTIAVYHFAPVRIYRLPGKEKTVD
jgi:4-amino-4-deoxy-L-arabinose transferase-like glycosyltransferase